MTETELKERLLSIIRTDKDFAFEIHKLILKLYGDELLTKTYFDEALVKYSQDLKREFYSALEKQSEELRKEFYSALEKQSEELRKEFYSALEKQSEDLKKFVLNVKDEIDRKIDREVERLDRKIDESVGRLDRKLEAIGGRWGLSSEKAITKFAEDLVSSWGGEVKKWKSSAVVKIGDFEEKREYEIDIVVKDGVEMVVEVKSSCSVSEVERFEEAVRVYEQEVGRKVSEKRIVTYFIYEDAKKLAEKKGIKVIYP
ncbi:MAG: DUF3782 domain-containing protein [Spirochaetia bacterium]|nr:DUF3782 domain-containing protein [Spirochaetota bacterium]MDW8112618.1 DUF3782 domain-containing protein [Spirochaetia bacterium]